MERVGHRAERESFRGVRIRDFMRCHAGRFIQNVVLTDDGMIVAAVFLRPFLPDEDEDVAAVFLPFLPDEDEDVAAVQRPYRGADPALRVAHASEGHGRTRYEV